MNNPHSHQSNSKPICQQTTEFNKENTNCLNTLRMHKIPQICIPHRHSPQSTSRQSFTQRNQFQNKQTERNTLAINSDGIYSWQSHQKVVLEILKENKKHLLMEIFHKFSILPQNQNHLAKISQIQELINQEIDRKVQKYQQKLLEVVEQIKNLKKTISSFEQPSNILYGSPQKNSQHKNTHKLKFQLDSILSSIKKQSQESDLSCIKQRQITRPWAEFIVDSQISCPWKEIFETFKWVYKFCLQILAVQYGVNDKKSFKQIKEVYQYFKNLKVPVYGTNKCHLLLQTMKKCNQKLSVMYNWWLHIRNHKE